MGVPTTFPGANIILTAPDGMEEQVADLPVFRNGQFSVSAWELSDEELEEIIRTRRVHVAILGQSHPPIYVGDEEAVRKVTGDHGGCAWPRHPVN